ncbi:MAG: hypothetical protein JWR00_1558 [Rubritepida sp.]|nr:hypothetical protein [Rubritepida sp.]
MAQTLGVVDIVWKGKRIPVEKGAKAKPGGMKNSKVELATRVDRSESFEAGEVSCTTVLLRGQSFVGMYSTGGGELQVICDTGQSLIWSDAFLTELIEMTGGEGGKIELKWTVGVPQELLNG